MSGIFRWSLETASDLLSLFRAELDVPTPFDHVQEHFSRLILKITRQALDLRYRSSEQLGHTTTLSALNGFAKSNLLYAACMQIGSR